MGFRTIHKPSQKAMKAFRQRVWAWDLYIVHEILSKHEMGLLYKYSAGENEFSIDLQKQPLTSF